MTPDSPNSGQQEAEKEIEKLAQEIGRLIRAADPQRREDLKELAYTLIREEMFETGGEGKKGEGSPPGPFNPLGTGVLFLILGAGLFFVFPGVGIVLALFGMIFILWGAVISWVKR